MWKRGEASRLSSADHSNIQARMAQGATLEMAARAAGCTVKSIRRQQVKASGLKARTLPRSEWRLSLAEREEISRSLPSGESLRSISRRLGRAASTVSRDVEAAGGRRQYRAWHADGAALARARRPKVLKLVAQPRLRYEVEQRLAQRWSPQQISARLKSDFPLEPALRVSPETIYRSLFIQARGALRKELAHCLRTGRTQRKPPQRTDLRGRIPGMVMLSARPAEAEDRAIPGHWEGDLIIGKGGKSAIGTLVERHSRYVMLLELSQGKTAMHVREALAASIGQLPEQLRRSLTWDQGTEMAEHGRFTLETNLPVYFCDPHSPWQRGSNENTNGLLRQYFPKGTDLSVHSRQHLEAVARELNGRPRQTLDWKTPAEVFAQSVAMTG